MNGTEKVSSGLVVASCDAPVLLELCEEVLNQMTSLVQVSVVFALIFARGARWNHDGLASLEQRLDHASLSVVGLVGQYGRAWGSRDKPKVEGSVLLVQRWILARFRNRQFFTLAELNRAIAELLIDLNQRLFKSKRSANPSFVSAMKLRTLRLGNQRDG